MFLFEQFNERMAPPQQVQKAAKTQSVPAEESGGEYEEYADDEDSDIDTGTDEQSIDPTPDLAPLKRYFLIQKLKELETQIEDYNIKNTGLDIVLKFINNLSYNSLLLLSTGIIQTIEDQIARLKNDQSA